MWISNHWQGGAVENVVIAVQDSKVRPFSRKVSSLTLTLLLFFFKLRLYKYS